MLDLAGHAGPVYALQFDFEGRRLFSGSRDGHLHIWDAPFLSRDIRIGSPIQCLALSEDGTRLAMGSDDRLIRVFDAETLEEISRGSSDHFGIVGLAFLQDDRSLAVAIGEKTRVVSAPQSLYLWDPATRARGRGLTEYRDGVRSLDSHPASRTIVMATDKRNVTLRDLTRQHSTNWKLPTIASSVTFSPNGRQVAVACDWKILLYDVDSTYPRLTMGGHKGVVQNVAFTPDGTRLLSGSGDRTVRVWDVASGAEQSVWDWQVGRVNVVTVAPDGLRGAVGGENGRIVVWDLDV